MSENRYAALSTEASNPRSAHLDEMETLDLVRLMNDENRAVPEAVEAVLPSVARLIDETAPRMDRGGRLIYVGAGTSGRLGVIDAAECPPTFGVSYEEVVGVIAGGRDAMFRAAEGGEDSAEAGRRDLAALSLTADDTVVGISAAGGAAYVLAALSLAKETGCLTAGITSNPDSPLAKTAEIAIAPQTGAEVLTGSTRLKAGTAQKLVLNMISTGVMVRRGMVYRNLMINVRPTNLKLHDRAVRILLAAMDITQPTDADYAKASDALDRAGSIRGAIEQWDKNHEQ